MQVLSNGRKRRTASEWREILDRFGRSGLSAREFCRRESLDAASLHRWRSRLAAPEPDENSAGEFVEVIPPSSDGASAWSVEVEFPDGRVLRMQG